MTSSAAKPAAAASPAAIRIDGIAADYGHGRVIENISFDVMPGETFGLIGLNGAGKTTLIKILLGLMEQAEGRVEIFGKQILDPAAKAGIAYLPADRLGASGIGSLPITDNVTLPALPKFKGQLGLDRPGMQRWAADVTRNHHVRPNDPDMYLESLSGGNQQKVLLAKWLENQPLLFLLDEPTQGVDVGARQQVFAAIDRAVRAGTVVICASTDAEQLAQICNRVLVFAQGRPVAELTGSDVNKEEITYQCYTGLAVTQTALAP